MTEATEPAAGTARPDPSQPRCFWKVCADFGDGFVVAGKYATADNARRALLPAEWVEDRRALVDPTGRLLVVVHRDGWADGTLTGLETAVVRHGQVVGWVLGDETGWRVVTSDPRASTVSPPEPPGL